MQCGIYGIYEGIYVYKGIIGLDEDENNVIMGIVVLVDKMVVVVVVDKILRKAPLAAQSISAGQIRIQ